MQQGNERLVIDVDAELEATINEMESLHKEIAELDGANLMADCQRSVVDSITSQFGILGVVANSQDGGNVTTEHNFKKGITANEQDQQRYDNYRDMNNGGFTSEVRRQKGYEAPKNAYRDKHVGDRKYIKDGYTGKRLHTDKTPVDVEHIVSAHEFESRADTNLFLSPQERVDLASSDDNLTPISFSANRSKGSKAFEPWAEQQRTDNGKTNAEHFGVNAELAHAKDKKSRAKIEKAVRIGALKHYSKELLATGASDAAKTGYKTATGILMQRSASAIFNAFKRALKEGKNLSLRRKLALFKKYASEAFAQIKKDWKEIVDSSFEAGISAFLSNLLVFAINYFKTLFKKAVAIIRAGFQSLVKAARLLMSPPEGMSKRDVRYEAAKVFTAGVITASSLLLSESISKLLQATPLIGPFFAIPTGEDSVIGDMVADALSLIIGGLASTVAVYFIDQIKNSTRKSELQIELMTQGGVLVSLKSIQSWQSLDNAYHHLFTTVGEMREDLSEKQQSIEKSKKQTDDAVTGFAAAVENFGQFD